ncbi:MAG: PD40 domain-containing protein [Acidobacteria bacterium]|nr:PD40 domain-containing protein [Acidobacteriota bacterium]MBS1866213.1 PD40 domain-containing protein [Acidobacteriota bacterium]
MKGPERLERAGYPPIPLDPAEVEQETTGSTWTYHAKDAQTQAAVAVHLSREACTVGVSDTKYPFRVALDHAQIGTLRGCARIAPDQFPEFKQKNLDDDDPEKKKPAPPTISFKPPVAVAYLDSSGRVMLARNDVPKLVAPKGSQLSLSHDGKRLLFVREENGQEVSLQLYDSATGKTSELLRGPLEQPFWSPDDSRIAFLKSDSSVWHIWTLPSNAVSSSTHPTQLSPTPVNSLDGWSDAHTLVGANASSFFWITDDGGTAQTISALDLCGPDFQSNADAAVRVSPANSDLLLISGSLLKTPPNSPKDPKTNLGADLFLYELRSKRRVPLNISNLLPTEAEWSRDGIQIYFTSREATGKSIINRIFWDASNPKKVRPGSNFVIGQ